MDRPSLSAPASVLMELGGVHGSACGLVPLYICPAVAEPVFIEASIGTIVQS